MYPIVSSSLSAVVTLALTLPKSSLGSSSLYVTQCNTAEIHQPGASASVTGEAQGVVSSSIVSFVCLMYANVTIFHNAPRDSNAMLGSYLVQATCFVLREERKDYL